MSSARGAITRAMQQIGLGPLYDALGAIDTALGAAGSSSSNSIIFRPGAPTAPPYYAAWVEIETQVGLAKGDCTVVFDGSLAPLVIPATADLDGDQSIPPPPVVVIDEDNLTIDLTAYGAFAGTWHAVIRR